MTNRFFNNAQDLIPLGLARASTVEANLDAVASGFDAAQVELDASIRAPDGEVLNRLPSAATRALKGLTFDASGQPVASVLATQDDMNAAVSAASAALSYLNLFRGQYLGAAAGDPTLDGNGQPIGAGDIYFNTGTQRLKVYTGSLWVNGVDSSSGIVPDTRTISAGAGLSGGGNLQADRTLSVANNGITDAMLRTGAATSVVGRAGGTVGNVADIAATVDGQFLRRSAGALLFSALASGDITGALGFTPGNAAGQTWTGTHSFTTLQVSGNAVWHAGNFTPGNKADLASPTFTGTPAAPTAAPGTNTTQLATTAFVTTAVSGSGFVPSARTITPADSSLTGGGDLSANRTLAFSTTWGDARYVTLTGATMTGVLVTATSGAGGASLRIPHGSAPTSPVNGDVWTTATAIMARLNGASRSVWHDGNLTPSNYALLTGATFTGDITTYRSGSPTTGAIFFGNAGNRYLYYDGTGFSFGGASLMVGGVIKGNNGGSGLGAITVSTSGPSGGTDGDLWFQY